MLFTAETLASVTGGTWKNGSTDVEGIYTDTRRNGKGMLFCALAGERFDAHDFLPQAVDSGAAALCVKRDSIVPPGIPVLEVKDTLAAYQALGAFCRKSIPELTVIAVTGSVGKTSVKEMLRAIFNSVAGTDAVLATDGNTNNHIGVPQNLLRLTEKHRFAILEMGMSHPGEILPLARIAEPDISVINSIAPCHIEHLGSLEGIAREKGNIFKGLKAHGKAVIPDGLAQTPILEEAAKPFTVSFAGTSERCDVKAVYLGGSLKGSSFELIFKNGSSYRIDWHLSGRHQAANAAVAAAAALCAGVSPETICAALPDTRLPGMRSKITCLNDVTYINDAYNANPASMAASLDYLSEFVQPEKLILLLGGMLELGTESEAAHTALLQSALERFPGAEVLVFGKPFAASSRQYPVTYFEKPSDAEETLSKLIFPGCIVFAKGSRGIGVEKALPAEAR